MSFVPEKKRLRKMSLVPLPGGFPCRYYHFQQDSIAKIRSLALSSNAVLSMLKLIHWSRWERRKPPRRLGSGSQVSATGRAESCFSLFIAWGCCTELSGFKDSHQADSSHRAIKNVRTALWSSIARIVTLTRCTAPWVSCLLRRCKDGNVMACRFVNSFEHC